MVPIVGDLRPILVEAVRGNRNGRGQPSARIVRLTPGYLRMFRRLRIESARPALGAIVKSLSRDELHWKRRLVRRVREIGC